MIHVLHLGLSYGCNMSCKHCFVTKNKDRLSTADIKSLIDKLYEQGLFIVYYTYGEPLLAKNLFEVSSYVKSKGLVQVLMTNGSLISDNTLYLIKTCGIQNVFVSIDSISPSEHDTNRGFHGSFDLAIEGIRQCRSNGISVGIATTVTQSNIPQLRDIYNFGVQEKVSIISFLRQRKDGYLLPIPKELIELYHSCIFEWISSDGPIGLSIHDPTLIPWLSGLFNNHKISRTVYDKYREMCSCHARTTISISPDGVASACNLSYLPLGNVIEDPIDELVQAINNGKDFICCSSLS